MPNRFVIATFTDPDSLLAAVRTIRDHSFPIYDVYTPYPVHHLDLAMGLRRTYLPWITLMGGALGLTLAFSFLFYTNVLDWPMNVGGKPDNSTLAFIPICFELTVLIGGLSTVAALLFRARLYPGKKERLPALKITNDTFAIVLRRRTEHFDPVLVSRLLWNSGASEVSEIEAQL
ncbi:MAG: DUF3341 domain-containing protein [Terracidiphilus sp.]|jgi:hypothetical protein